MDRSDRVSDEIQKVLSVILRDEIRDPRLPSFVSVTEVKVTRDLSHANAYISVFGDDKAKSDCLAALKSANGFIRREIVKRIKLRIAPEIHFILDDSIERGMRISGLIDKALENDKASDAAKDTENIKRDESDDVQ
ncbi:MAG: 30S ribosome-binding factor RbfA [Saccharofermentanales bacterium]